MARPVASSRRPSLWSAGLRARPGWGAAGDIALTSDPRILVVAPDDDLVGSLCQGLDALGWRTVTARSLAGAVQVLIDWPLEAVILDARTPDAEGGVTALRQTVTPTRRNRECHQVYSPVGRVPRDASVHRAN